MADLGSLRVMTGTYSGTGKPRTVTLPVSPKLLQIFPESGPAYISMVGDPLVVDNPAVLADGASRMELAARSVDEGYAYYRSTVKLSGTELVFSGSVSGLATASNRSGVQYRWVALY